MNNKTNNDDFFAGWDNATCTPEQEAEFEAGKQAFDNNEERDESWSNEKKTGYDCAKEGFECRVAEAKRFKLPDSFVEQFYHKNLSKITEYATKEYVRLCYEAYRRDTLLPFDGRLNRNVDAIGRILAIMFKTDDWQVLALAKELADNDAIRESIYSRVTGGYQWGISTLALDDKERMRLVKIHREALNIAESAKGKSEKEIEQALSAIADCLSMAVEQDEQ